MRAYAADTLTLLACLLCEPLSTMHKMSQTVITHKHYVLDEVMSAILIKRMMHTQSNMQLLWRPCIQYTKQRLVIGCSFQSENV